MFTIHATKKLLARVKQPVGEPVADPGTALGNWYATALFWRPQAALFVNERTLLPVFVPLAPAAKVAERLPDQLGRLLDALDASDVVDPWAEPQELSADEVRVVEEIEACRELQEVLRNVARSLS